jgi:hypothetical protein
MLHVDASNLRAGGATLTGSATVRSAGASAGMR